MKTAQHRTTAAAPAPAEARPRRQEGIALLVTVTMLVIATMIGLTALQQTQEESTAGGRQRASARTLHAADAGVEFAISRLSQATPVTTGFTLDIEGATVQTRRRTQGSQQNISQLGAGGAADGYAINIGGGTTATNLVFMVNITATSGGSVAEIETLVSRPEVTSGGTY